VRIVSFVYRSGRDGPGQGSPKKGRREWGASGILLDSRPDRPHSITNCSEPVFEASRDWTKLAFASGNTKKRERRDGMDS